MNQKGLAHLLLLIILLAGIAIAVYLTQFTQVFKPKASEEETLYPIEETTIDSQSTQSGTYSSHNQKVVSNKHGIFIAYIHSTDPKTAESNWRLMRSTDQGKTFSLVYQSTNGTTPPALETDDGGNVFLIHSDYKTGQVFFYRFAASLNFQNPKITKVPNMGTVGKFATEIDIKRRLIYYFSQYNKFIAFDYGGGVRKNLDLTKNGPNAVMQYPYLYLDNGDLYVAWTNYNYPSLKNSLGNQTVYRSIHFVTSKDGGTSWQKSDGQPLRFPVTVDETGPSHLVSILPEEYGGLWLSSFIVKNGKAHFVYKVSNTLTIDPPKIREDRMHYVRFDLKTGQIDKNIYPEFAGENIKLNWRNGYFISGNSQDLYYVSRSANSLALLKSSDNGETWHDHTLGDYSSRGINHITGQPSLTADNKIIGIYTDQDLNSPSRPYSVKFFQVNTLPDTFPSPNQSSIPSPSVQASLSPSPSLNPLPSPSDSNVPPGSCSSDSDCPSGQSCQQLCTASYPPICRSICSSSSSLPDNSTQTPGEVAGQPPVVEYAQ